jgi:hypothetical protein
MTRRATTGVLQRSQLLLQLQLLALVLVTVHNYAQCGLQHYTALQLPLLLLWATTIKS